MVQELSCSIRRSVRSDDAYEWTGQPLLYKTSGDFNYDLNLYFPLDE